MEITYTDDKGESVEIINHHIEIPAYIKEFDEHKSFLNIKSEDVAMLFHSNKPMSKAVTIGRYQMFLKMDFDNFMHSKFADTIHRVFADFQHGFYTNLYKIGDKTIDSFIDVIQECHEHIINSCTRQVVINDESYVSTLLYLRVCSALRKKWNNEDVEYLAPFFAFKKDAYIKVGVLTLDDKEFVASLISVMKAQDEKYRKEIYSAILILAYIYDASSSSAKVVDALRSYSYKSKGNSIFQGFEKNDENNILTAEELAVFNGSCLSEEDKQAVRNRMSRFAQFQNSQIIQKSLGHYAIERRKIKLSMLTPQEWLDIFIDRVNELRIKNEYPANVDIEDVNTPKCYFAFLVENISEDKIELSNDEPLVNGLLYLIYIKGYKDIAYIAKEILILNYIIDHMADAVMSSDSEVALNTAIKKAVDFIDVVFTSKFRCKTYSDVELKSKFKQILKDKELCDKVCKISPNKFDGGFNLVLVYNIIGLFRDIKLINGGISTIATAIAVSRNQINEKGKPQIRKEYISNWNIEIGEHKQTELSKNLIKRLEAIYL